MTQNEKAKAFNAAHIKSRPLILTNIWDAGSAKVVAEAGATALATGSWSVAAAQGYQDGEAMPLELLLSITRRITETSTLPLSVDFESGYALSANDVALNIAKIIEAGAIGINFEDGIAGSKSMHPIEFQCERIRAIRAKAEQLGLEFFINARTDVFLQSDADQHSVHYQEALTRAKAYSDAGASGIFIPGLVDEVLIERFCNAIALPVNIMRSPQAASEQRLAELGVSRISYGPYPYIHAMEQLTQFRTQ